MVSRRIVEEKFPHMYPIKKRLERLFADKASNEWFTIGSMAEMCGVQRCAMVDAIKRDERMEAWMPESGVTVYRMVR